jgi:UMF1 family MFS transporter
MAAETAIPQSGWHRTLQRLGLDRPELRAWAMYDWANSAFMTTIITAVFPYYYQTVAAEGLDPAAAIARFGLASTVAVSAVAVLSPILGALADYAGIKKRMLALFMGTGVLATAAMALVGPGDWLLALVLFVIGNIGAFGSMAFYDSLLPHVARHDEIDRVSSAGYAIGYLGGGLLLALNAAWLLSPATFGLADRGAGARLSFLSVAVWWCVFALPLFRHVPEPPRALEADERPGANPLGAAFSRLGETFRELRTYRQAFLMLAAFAVYNDGINTIIRMATIFGTQIGLGAADLMPAILMVQFVGVPFAFLFGGLAGRIGVKPAIFLALAVYTGISTLGYFMTSALVATVQGGSQALSRSLFATMVPRHKSSEFFGFFGIFEKFTGILGPAIFTGAVATTGSTRIAILSVMGFFIVGGALLAFVNVADGQRAAREANAGAAIA